MYVPNNVLVYIAAYSGSISGMAVAGKLLTDDNPADYAAVCTVAGAFAESFDTEWGLAAPTDLDLSIIEEECEGAFNWRYPNTSKPNTMTPATYTAECKALIALVQASQAYFAGQGIVPPFPGGGGGGGGGKIINLSVNSANVDFGWKRPITGTPTAVLRTGSRVNLTGSFNGGGTGNKSIIAARDTLNGLPISSLISTSFTWRNLLGPGGPFFNPVGPAGTTVPYMNLLVDFDPLGIHDLRYLAICDSGLGLTISAAIGLYTNPGGNNTLTYSWNNTLDVLIVSAPPNPVPGGVPVHISVGPGWPQNSYSWAALVAANPQAIFVDAFPAVFGAPTGDGGAPAGAIVPAISIASGDSGNIVKSGKHILEWMVNGVNVLTT
jgi:hypothetical protein